LRNQSGLYSAAVGHDFARHGNRFWPALQMAGFTPRLLDPSEERELLEVRLGITNIVDRATEAASELTADELRRVGTRLLEKLQRFYPRFLAVLRSGRITKPSIVGTWNLAANRNPLPGRFTVHLFRDRPDMAPAALASGDDFD
jgi:G:T/U-mismatch repair DNA glycosylase